MDPNEMARVKSVVPGSSAEKDGFRAGDEIRSLDGEMIVSVADLQWVLHEAGDAASLEARVLRSASAKPDEFWDKILILPLKLTLAPGWRARGDISWRASSWDLRRMTTGGMLLDALPAAERTKLGIADAAMALVAKHVGQYGAQAAAKNAGFRQGDVIVAAGGRTDVRTETEWMTWLVNAKKPGDTVPVTVLRDGKSVELTLPMQ
jgi:serine protease Do